MKILIAGDSMSAVGDQSWDKSLAYEYVNVSSYGIGAFEIYQRVKAQDLSQFDTVILVLTGVDRTRLSNGTHINRFYDTKSKQERDMLSRLYFEKFYNAEQQFITYEACYRKIIELVRGKKILVLRSVFDGDINLGSDILIDNLRMADITLKEVENIYKRDLYSLLVTDFEELPLHTNHLTPINRKLLAQRITDLLEYGTSSITLQDFYKMNQAEFQIYYKART
jgi:hypothetical protein